MIGVLLLTISATATAQYRPPRMSSGFHQNVRGAPLAPSASKDRPYVSIPIVLMQDGQVVPKPTQASYQYLGNLPGHLSSVQGSQQESAGNYQVVLPTSHPSQGLFKKNPPARSAKQLRHQVYQKGNPNIANFLNLATQLGAQELQRNAQHQQALMSASQQEAQKHQEQQQQFQGQQGNAYAQAQPPQVQQMQNSIQNANTQQYANSRQPVQQVSTTQQSVHFRQGRQQAQANAYQQQTQHGYNHQHANQGAPMANPSGSSKQQAFAPQPVLEIYDGNSQAVNQAHSSVNQALANQMGQQQYAVADPNASPLGYPNLSYQAQQQVPQVSQNYYISPQDQKMFSAYQSQQSSLANVPNHSVVQQGNSNGSPQQPYVVVPNFQNVYTPQNGQTVISSQNNNQASNREPSTQLVSYSFINEQQQQPKQESHIPNNSYQIPSGYQLTPPLTNNYQNPATFSNTNNYQTSTNAANYQSSPNNYQSANPALNSYQTSNQESNNYQNANQESNNYQNANQESNSYQNANQESNSYQNANQESNNYQNANQESNNYQTANQESNGYQAANNNYPRTNQVSSVPQSSSQTNNYQSSVPSSNYQSPGSSTNNYQNSALTTSNNYQSSAPTTSNNYQSSAPTTSNNYQSSAPTTSNNYQSSAPSTSNSYQSSAPSTSNSYQSSAPSTSNSYQSSAPSTNHNYQSSAPSTNHNYQSSAPSTSNSYQSSAPSTNSYSVPATSSYQIASYQNPQQSATTPKQQESSNSGGQLIFASTSAKQINYSPSETSYPSTQQQGNASPAQSYYRMESSSTPSASGLVTPGSTYVKLSQSMAASLGVTSPSQGDQDNDYEDADEEETSYKVVYIPLDILKNILSNNVESNQRSDKES